MSILHLDDIPYQSPLRKLDPGFKLFFSLGTIVLTIALNRILISAIVFSLMVLLSLLWGKVNLRRYLILLSIPMFFIIVGVLTIMVDQGKNSLWALAFGIWGFLLPV